jgi:dUTPase
MYNEQSLYTDAFLTLHSAEKKTIPAHGKALVDTQISIAVPAGTYGRVAPRSGLGMPTCPGKPLSAILTMPMQLPSS